MSFHKTECGGNVRGAHPRHGPNGLRRRPHSQLDDDLAAGTPNMDVRRLVLAWRQIDEDAEAPFPEHGRHLST